MQPFLISSILFIVIPSMLISANLNPISPDETGYDWMDKIAKKELATFQGKGISREKLKSAWNICRQQDKANNKNRFNRFQIIDNKVYGPSCRLKNLLHELVEHYAVPNVDFIWFNYDCIQEGLLSNLNVPIFISAKKETQNRFVLFSDSYFDISGNALANNWMNLIDEFDSQEVKWDWSHKIEKLFWRGSPTDGPYNTKNFTQFPRGKLVALSKTNPLIDAAFITSGFFSKRAKKLKGVVLTTDPVLPIDHSQFKYQLIIDGVTSTFPGTHWRLYSGCVSFKQTSKNVLWFFGELKPYFHYIPVANDMSDLITQIKWAKAHDLECRKIADNAKNFVKSHLMPEHILLYCYKVLLEYASLQTYDPAENFHP